VADEMPFLTDFFSGLAMYGSTRRLHKFLLTPPIFPREDKKKVLTSNYHPSPSLFATTYTFKPEQGRPV